MSKKNIAPRYLRKLKDGQWFYFKYKDEHWCATEWNEFPYAFKKPNSPLLFSPDSLGGYEVISGWMISYFRPCSEKFAKQQIEQAEVQDEIK